MPTPSACFPLDGPGVEDRPPTFGCHSTIDFGIVTIRRDINNIPKRFLHLRNPHKIRRQELHWVHTTWGANLHKQVIEGPFFDSHLLLSDQREERRERLWFFEDER